MRSSVSILFLALLVVATLSVYVPSTLRCGTENDLFVPSFPFFITGNLTDHSKIVATWAARIPALNTTYVVNNVVVSQFDQQNVAYHEINETGVNMSDVHTEQFSSLSWEVSATKIAACEGFFMRATFDNRAVLEYTWYFFNSDKEFTYAGKSYTAKKGDLNAYLDLHNYPFASEVSKPDFEMFMIFPRAITAQRKDWQAELGGSSPIFPADPLEQNVTTFGITNLTALNPVPGWVMDPMTLTPRYMNYALFDDNKMNVHFRAVGDGIYSDGVRSFRHYATFLGDYSSGNVTSWLQRLTFVGEAHMVAASGDDSMSGGASKIGNFNLNIFSFLLSFLYALF